MFSTNLIPPLTSFIGRTKELAEIKSLLSRTRLLTLTGVGGCGKTRLAMQVATEFLTTESYPDGIWWIDLVGLSDPTLVPQVVCRALNLRESPDTIPLTDILKNYLTPKNLLLVLDNCEHLLAACSELVKDLLPNCPVLQILATSREPLGVAGEISWLVPSLPLPEMANSPSENYSTPSHLVQYDAVSLFVERASSVAPTFTLTNQNAEAVTLICQRLDGLPLAIELAAARINVLSLQQIAERLDDRFALLTGGNRTALIPRHQTLRTTMDWSYELLSKQEQTLFRRLSVFAGGFTLEAVEAICIDNGVQRKDILNLLSHLIDKSLVLVTAWESDQARYRLLETIRQYALEKLQESGEENMLCSQHRDWFLMLAENAETHLKGAEQIAWLNRLESEHDNLRAALAWRQTETQANDSPTTDPTEAGLRLAGALFWFWNLHGYLSEGRHWLEEILEQANESNNTASKAKALYAAGELARLQGDHAAEYLLHEKSVSIWQSLVLQLETITDTSSKTALTMIQLKRGQAIALCYFGISTFSYSNHPLGKSLVEESVRLSKSIEAQWELGYALSINGQMSLYEGDYATARIKLEESMKIFGDLGDKWGLGLTLHWRAAVALAEIDHSLAREQLEEALGIFRELGDKWNIALMLNRLGEVARSQGDDQRALPLYEQTLAIHRELGTKWGLSFSLHNLGYIALHQGDYVRATELFKEALSLNLDRKDSLGIASCLAGIAGVAMRSAPEQAIKIFGKTQALLDETGFVMASTDSLEIERNLNVAHSKLDATAFEQAWEAGRAFTLEQAIDAAMQIVSNQKSYAPLLVQPANSPERLNERELEILRLIAKGLSNHEIAGRLILAVSTVKWYINNIFGKLHVRNRIQAVARARELKLL